MYTVGLIDGNTIKTSVFELLEESMADIRCWKNCIMNNNVIVSRTTITKRDETDTTISIKDIFELKNGKELILFLSKSN